MTCVVECGTVPRQWEEELLLQLLIVGLHVVQLLAKLLILLLDLIELLLKLQLRLDDAEVVECDRASWTQQVQIRAERRCVRRATLWSLRLSERDTLQKQQASNLRDILRIMMMVLSREASFLQANSVADRVNHLVEMIDGEAGSDELSFAAGGL